MNPFLLTLVAYLLGSTPTSWMASRWIHGVDLTRRGSGNLGATNVFRVLGWKTAVPVVVVDIGKGFLPAWLFPVLDTPVAWWWAVVYGGAAIVGHVFSFWLRFRGGKGVATSAGVLLAVAPVAVLSALVVWLVVVFTTRIVSLGSLAAAATAMGAIWIAPPVEGARILQLFVTLLGFFVLWAHRSNVGRLLRGEENRFGSDGRSAEPPAPDAREPDTATGGR